MHTHTHTHTYACRSPIDNTGGARFDPATGFLKPSTYTANGKEYPNMTLINLALVWFGPMRERSLTLLLLTFQAACCALALYLRLVVGSSLYDA